MNLWDKVSKEFRKLDGAQEALRLWYEKHPGEDPPAHLLKGLRDAEAEHAKTQRKSWFRR